MKKIFLAVMLSVFALVSSNICSAKMPVSEMYLSGLTFGTSYNEIVRIYGKPTTSEYHGETGPTNNPNANYAVYKYGYSVIINCSNHGKKTYRIAVTENNGWKTPSGIAVGSNISDVLDLYGNPDYIQTGSFKTAYCYFGDMYSTNKPEFGFIILFNKNSGKILQMEINSGTPGMIAFWEGNYCKNVMEVMVE